MQRVQVHGYERAFFKMGEGPPLLLIHGLGSHHRTWLPAISWLAERYTVIAPDLLGHGESAKPRADYSAGGYANGMRDLLAVLGVERVTVVGHSFGGGVAMQFAYQYPQLVERIVLVASGGLGRQMNPLLRALTLPGSGLALSVATAKPVRPAASALMRAAHRSRLPYTADGQVLCDVYSTLDSRESRRALLHVLRAHADWRGQVISMRDRAYMTRHVPCLVVWGKRDCVLPVAHAQVAREVMPGASVQIFGRAGHFPHEDQPAEFAAAVIDFIESTPAAAHDPHRWRRRLVGGLNMPSDLAVVAAPSA